MDSKQLVDTNASRKGLLPSTSSYELVSRTWLRDVHAKLVRGIGYPAVTGLARCALHCLHAEQGAAGSLLIDIEWTCMGDIGKRKCVRNEEQDQLKALL